MIKSKVIDILQTFNNKEMKSLGEFINSPFHNKNALMFLLYTELRKFHPKYNSSELTKEYLFRKVYKKNEYNDAAFRNLLSDLLKLTEKFLVYSFIDSSPPENYRILNHALLSRKAYGMFLKNYKLSVKELEGFKPKENDYLYYKWVFERQQFEWLNKIQYEKYDNYSTEIQDLINSIESYFAVSISILYNRIINIQELVNKKFEMRFLDGMIEYTKNDCHKNNNLMKIMHMSLRMNRDKDEESFKGIKKLIPVFPDILDYDNCGEMLSFLLNFSTYKYHNGNIEYLYEYLQVNEIFIEQGQANNESGYLSEIAFRNVVDLYIILGKFDEAGNFIEKYYDQLAPKLMLSNYNYTKALVACYKGENRLALEYLNKIKHDDYLFKYQIDCLTMRVYYELGLLENCFSIIDSNSHFIAKNKEGSKTYKMMFSNFLKYYKLIVSIKAKEDFRELPLIKKNLLSEKLITAGNWLLKKIEEFEKK